MIASSTATRRTVVRGLAAAASASLLSACAGDDGGEGGGAGSDSSGGAGSTGVADDDDDDDGGGGSSGAGSGGGSGSGAGSGGGSGSDAGDDDGVDSTDGDSGSACPEVDGWATGGTAAMCGRYPDPFARGLGNACTLQCSATLGPCYAQTLERQDISEGNPGLPVRLVFVVVDESCTPIAGEEVDIWHTSPDGLYSGEDSPSMCTFDDPEAIAGRWFRGVQVTDDAGRVQFDTCYPGWYGGRTIHIHFTIRIAGVGYLTSQLVFDDALSDAIIASEPIYSDRGPRDTTNATDNVVGGAADLAPYTMQTEHMPDGAMLAYKALVIRGSTADPLCSLGGGGGPPGG